MSSIFDRPAQEGKTETLRLKTYVYHYKRVTSNASTGSPVEKGRRVDKLKELFRTLAMIRAIEDCHRSNIYSQLHMFKELGGFGTTESTELLYFPLTFLSSFYSTRINSIMVHLKGIDRITFA